MHEISCYHRPIEGGEKVNCTTGVVAIIDCTIRVEVIIDYIAEVGVIISCTAGVGAITNYIVVCRVSIGEEGKANAISSFSIVTRNG